jgi:uncharacterized damage-inducible protein DinB
MTTDDVRRLFAYNRWANAKTIKAAGELGDEKLNRDCRSSFPSVFATLVHMLGAEWIWLERWNGSSPSVWPDMDAVKTLADLRARWADVEAGQRTRLSGLDDAQLAQPLAYRNMKGEAYQEPLGLVLQHVVNHGTHHRGQIGTMTRQLGGVPAGTDYIVFVREGTA